MSDNLCIRCGRPTPDGYCCPLCASRAAEQLERVAEYTPAARDVAQGLSRRASGGGASGKPGSRLPLDLSATSRLDHVQNTLTTWARHAMEERGSQAQHVGTDPIVHSAWYLIAQVEWFRHRPECKDFLTDVEACTRVVAGLARGPQEQKYLGPCGALLIAAAPPQDGCDCGHEGLDSWYHLKPCPVAFLEQRSACDGDVYGPRGGSKGTCRTCGATVDQAEREAWLDGEVRAHAFRASEIEDAYGVKANLIRQWATPARSLLTVHGHDRDGRALYLLSQVLDVAAGQKARQAGQQAKRAARRAESAA